ncbi:YcnI family copper-binding membrane protein [Bacillus massiliglaciei]|uniref:YcnI family copper-binding membrane protein n=1 Tax=Bacillus massiliglaciei TaxID=1816693 RepID=UPI000B26A04B|nr:YcnI family protein [Bacillus massiliglaciei]
MKKLLTAAVTMFGAITLFAGAASAHVTVQPQETEQGKYEVFTVRVPSENEKLPTTKVEVKFPYEVNITRFEPKAGWTYEVKKDETDKITSVTWTAEDEGLSPTEFGQFNMQGKVDDEAKEIVWKAYQTYKDGSVVEWVGAPDAETPASVTTVNPASGNSHHGHENTSADTASDQVNVKEEKNASNPISLYLSIAALLAGLVSLVISLRRKRS